MALLLDNPDRDRPLSSADAAIERMARGFEPVRPTRIDGWPTSPVPADAPRTVWRIAKDVRIRGELDAALDMSIDGEFDGRLSVAGFRLSTGAVSRVHADIVADTVIVRGELVGSIVASSRISIARTARVRGELFAPSIELVDGCSFDGRIDGPPPREH